MPYTAASQSVSNMNPQTQSKRALPEAHASGWPREDCAVRTGRDDRYVDQAKEPHLPVGERRPDVPHIKPLVLSNRRAVVFSGFASAVLTLDQRSGAGNPLLRCITNARSPGVRNLAVAGKSTSTARVENAGQVSFLSLILHCRFPGPPKNATMPTTTVAIPSMICHDQHPSASRVDSERSRHTGKREDHSRRSTPIPLARPCPP